MLIGQNENENKAMTKIVIAITFLSIALHSSTSQKWFYLHYVVNNDNLFCTQLLCESHQPTKFQVQLPLKSPIGMFEHDDDILHYPNLISLGDTIGC